LVFKWACLFIEKLPVPFCVGKPTFITPGIFIWNAKTVPMIGLV